MGRQGKVESLTESKDWLREQLSEEGNIGGSVKVGETMRRR